MDKKEEVRIDKWLWAVRLFKSRSIAVEACKKNRVLIKDAPVKPSRMIKVGDVIQIKRTPIIYSFEVLDLSEKRMGAKLVSGFMKDVTPASELKILEQIRMSGFVDRARGTGRPTKKDRRDLSDFSSELQKYDFDEWNFDEED